MKRFFLILSLFPLLIHAAYEGSPLSELEKPGSEKEVQTIQVLIKKNIDGALIDVKNGYQVINPENQKKLSSGSSGKRYYLQTTPSGLKWGEGYIGIHQIKIVPKDLTSSILIDGIQYKGSLSVYDINGQIQVVNEVDIEECLKSILSLETEGKNLNEATLEALAINARTNLYDIVFRRQNPYWDAKAEDLGYLGGGAVLVNPDVEKAVNGTKHLVMTYNDKPFPTTWTENSAGRTASYVDIFRKKSETPQGVLVAYAQKMREDHKWKCVIAKERLAKMLHLERITSIDLFQDSSAKKTYAIRFTDGKNVAELTFVEFQSLMGSNRILSNDMQVHLLKENTVFEGYGKGPGVGICLYSANEMAKARDTSVQILAYFYPETVLVKLGKIPESMINKVEEEEAKA